MIEHWCFACGSWLCQCTRWQMPVWLLAVSLHSMLQTYESHKGHYCTYVIEPSSPSFKRLFHWGFKSMRQFYRQFVHPAVYCMTSFNKTHLCPVFLQMAILELRAAQPDDPLAPSPASFASFVAADRAQLKKHLTTLHSFPCHDWTPARDSLEDQVTCAHCGSVHHCQQALRKHIIYGHCSQFDLARLWTTKRWRRTLLNSCQWDALTWFWADLEMRRRTDPMIANSALRSFSQVSNLVGHLCQQHSETVWRRRAISPRFYSRDLLYEAAVVCHASNNSDRPNTCILFHQLSMKHFNGNAFVEYACGVWWCCQGKDGNTCAPSIVSLDAWCLEDKKIFEFVSTRCKPFVQSWGQQCLCCGSLLHWTGPGQRTCPSPPPPNNASGTASRPSSVWFQMVIHRKGSWSLDYMWLVWRDNCCQLMQTMHTMTPVLFAFLWTWLLIPLTSSSHGSRAGGRAIPDSGCVWDAGGLRGSKRPLSEEAKKGPAMGNYHPGKPSAGSDGRSSSKDAIPDVPTDFWGTRETWIAYTNRTPSSSSCQPRRTAWCPRSCRPAIGSNKKQQHQANPISSAMLGASMWCRPWFKGLPRWWIARRIYPLWQSSLQKQG